MRFPLLVAMLAFAASPALAQSSMGPIEIGFDASISRVTVGADGAESTSLTAAQLPLQSVRVAIPVMRYLSIEPAVSVLYFSADGESQTSFSGEIAGLIHLSPDRTKIQPFLRPFVGYDHDTVLSGSSGDRMTFGGGLGMKVPAGSRFAFRVEGRYRHFAEVDETTLNSIGLVLGLSFFTK